MTALIDHGPAIDITDKDEVAAFHKGYAHMDYWRKVVLSACREAVRAEYALREERITESRLDDLGHLHPNYVEFLTVHLQGRIAYEAMARSEAIGS